MRLASATLLAASLATPTPARADVSLLATITIPPEATDLSGLTDMIATDTPHNRLGGFGSAIDRMKAGEGKGDEYILLPDRGPRDGGTAYRCRFHIATIKPSTPTSPTSAASKAWAFTLTKTVMLTDEQGRPFVGASGSYRPSGNPDGRDDTRLDPEGVRVGPDGTIYISDEYGPHVLAFSPEGKLLRRLAVPATYNPSVRGGLEEDELPPLSTTGRQPTRGFEGLAWVGEGTLLAFLQGPLIQDHALDDANERVSRFIRVLHVATSGTPPATPNPTSNPTPNPTPTEWVYPLKSAQFGTNELLAVTDRVFLAIERDSKEADKTKAKRITKVDFTNATNVAGTAELPPLALPAEIKPGSVTTLIDLLDPRFGLNSAAVPMPAKVEGLAFGPDLADGRRTLLVTTDNDFKPLEPSLIWVFAVDPAELAPSAVTPSAVPPSPVPPSAVPPSPVPPASR